MIRYTIILNAISETKSQLIIEWNFIWNVFEDWKVNLNVLLFKVLLQYVEFHIVIEFGDVMILNHVILNYVFFLIEVYVNSFTYSSDSSNSLNIWIFIYYCIYDVMSVLNVWIQNLIVSTRIQDESQVRNRYTRLS